MPKKCIKFIPEYLIPNLNNKRFGEHLKWIDKSKKIFEIDWCHKAGPQWTEQEAAVFVEWDKHKGHFQPGDKQYYTKSKQRFRSLLYKLTQEGHLKKLESPTKTKKVFCIGQKNNRRKKRNNNAEYDSSDKEEIASEQEYEYFDDICSRKVSEDDAINVLEDHSYSVSDNLQNSFTAFTSNSENEQVTLSNAQDWVSTLLNESSNNLQKRVVLMERNNENTNTLMPVLTNNFYTGSFPSECFGDETENDNFVMLAVSLADVANSSQPSMEFLDSLQTRLG